MDSPGILWHSLAYSRELVTEVVFKHLRTVCDRHASPHLLAFFSRILFQPQFAHGSDSGSLCKDDNVIVKRTKRGAD